MSINSKIISTINPLVAVCAPGIYSGESKEYCTFNYSELPELFGDDRPGFIRYLVQLHWFSPLDSNPLDKKNAIKNALSGAGFTYPSVSDASDDLSLHFAFEFEYVEGINEPIV